MNGMIIIKKENMGPMTDHAGPDAMVNVLHICDCVIKDKSDGDEVEVTVKGTLMEHDGMRFIAVDSVDGEPVEDMQMDFPMMPPDMGNQPSHLDTNAVDAVTHFFDNLNGK